MPKTETRYTTKCAHCGSETGTSLVMDEGVCFCCEGCKTVYHILHQNGLCDFYDIDSDAAQSLQNKETLNWTIEELNVMATEFVVMDSGDQRTIILHVPSIHCSSCIWLLEKLPDLNPGVLQCRTDFLKKQVRITYNTAQTQFGDLVYLLSMLGYQPSLMPEDTQDITKKENRKILLKLGVAGFCAGNIMMFSFPQYLGLNITQEPQLLRWFNALNIALSIPLVFYSGGEYIRSFKQWLQFKTLSVKVPLAIGIGALWLRSVYEAATSVGSGYFDSLAGLIFLLITGTWLQNKVFDSLRFGEKARKFFPLVARTIITGRLVPKKVIELVPGDRVRVLHGEIIPADGVLMASEALVQYAYATGESAAQTKVAGEVLLGGGRNEGGVFEMEVIRPFNQSRLNEIWNIEDEKQTPQSEVPDFEVVISKYFILGTLTIALAALLFWWIKDASQMWFAFVAVLMVACPCALALAPPFSYNIVSAFFAKKGLYLRKPAIAAKLGEITDVVFDKTGTLSLSGEMQAVIPASYTAQEIEILSTAASQSRHPYSVAIAQSLKGYREMPVQNFMEYSGRGSEASIAGHEVRLGKQSFVSKDILSTREDNKNIWLSIDGTVLEPITINDVFRDDLSQTFDSLKKQHISLHVASGDAEVEKQKLLFKYPKAFENISYGCSPSDKTEIIKKLKQDGHVLMIGDGLNDAGALKAGDVGIVVTDDTNNFTPEASAILLQNAFSKLPDFLKIAQKGNRIVTRTFWVSLAYNVVALSLAFSGNMSPLIAAILMPLSSVFLMVFAWLSTKNMVKREEHI